MNQLIAQQTGSFSDSFTHNSQSQTAHYYVPASYNSSNQYPLICANSGSSGNTGGSWIRDLMVGVADSLNAILVCPDVSSFLNPTDFRILHSAIRDAKSKYNIDPNSIYMSGHSFGGRGAFNYALDSSLSLKGAFPIAPAVQSASEANGSFYNYSNHNNMPICFIVGDQDNFLSNINLSITQLLNNGATFDSIIKPNVGHVDLTYLGTADFDHDCMECIRFINDNSISTTIEKTGKQPQLELVVVQGTNIPLLKLRNTMDEQTITVTLINNLGQVVYREKIVSGKNWKTLSTPSLSKGSYLFNARTKNESITKSFLILN